MSNKQTANRRWWHKQQPQGSKPESAAAVSDENVADVVEEQITVGSLTQEELAQMISDTVERTLEELLPKQLARQRVMLETELKWHLDGLLKDGVAADSARAANAAAKEPEEQPLPELNPAIDWSFLE